MCNSARQLKQEDSKKTGARSNTRNIRSPWSSSPPPHTKQPARGSSQHTPLAGTRQPLPTRTPRCRRAGSCYCPRRAAQSAPAATAATAPASRRSRPAPPQCWSPSPQSPAAPGRRCGPGPASRRRGPRWSRCRPPPRQPRSGRPPAGPRTWRGVGGRGGGWVDDGGGWVVVGGLNREGSGLLGLHA